MTNALVAAAVLLLSGTAVQPVFAQAQVPDTVRVAPPAGETQADRVSILGALERARPGDTVLFAPGTYLVGELIRLETPRLTLLGHPEGTVLRGCHPEEYEANEREALDATDAATGWRLLSRCGMLELTGGHVTVRNFTFEYSRLGLVLGCCEGEDVLRSAEGGYRVEANTFRNSGNSIRATLSSPEPTVIRGNRFINTFHALSGGVRHVHMLDNGISVPEPGKVPGAGHPGFAIGIRPPYAGPADVQSDGSRACEHNIIAGNRIVGHTDGIMLVALPGTHCRENTIRGNTIEVRRVPIPDDWAYADVLPLPAPGDSTLVGVPLVLVNIPARSGSAAEGEAGRLEDNLVEGNRIVGADGLGIEVLSASRNRIVRNTITGVRRRDPFPGNTTGGLQTWAEANGSAIWISSGSDGNEIVGNTFEDIAAAAVFLEGDDNRVEARSPDDVRDLGSRNRLVGGVDEGPGEVDAERLAQEVTIYRDAFGVPHVHGRTDEAAVFGLAYARAEDQYELIEHIFINRLGRASEVYGEEGLLSPDFERGRDLLVHAYRYPEEARVAWDGLPGKLRALIEAYTAGLNYYLEKHPEQEVRLLDRFEPWWVLAVEDVSESYQGMVHSGAFDADASAVMRGAWRAAERGSNAWAVGPAKTATGSAMLLLNPHDPSRWPYYECHIMSDEGLNSYGVLNYWGALMLPYLGFNDNLGWSVTVNEPDLGDTFRMTFDHPTDPSKYRFGDEYLTATTWETEIRVRGESGVMARTIPFTRTIHGPVLATSEDGEPISFRIARSPSGTLTEQLYRMHKATSLEEWKEAVALRGITYHNLMYADREGNVFYLYNGNVPVRDDAFDWTQPVDGSDPRTLWQGYHEIDELPQLLNPGAGYLQNANSSPFVTTHADNPDPADYPGYMTNLENGDTYRAQRSRQLLRSASSITQDDLQRMATSTYVYVADEWLPLLFAEWDSLGQSDASLRQRLQEPIAALKRWDRESNSESIATTLFVLWDEAYWLKEREGQPLPLLSSLAEAVDILEREFGTWEVAWKDVFRHQRRADGGAVSWDESRPSHPTSANHGRYGVMFNMRGEPYDGARESVKRRMTFGNSFVSIVEFPPDGPVARSIVAYGNSTDPDSPHYEDQAAMFARGSMKPVLFEMEDILANLEERYRPGEREQTIEEATADSVVRWLQSKAIRLRTVEAGNGFTDMQPLKEIVGDARIVALGEPTHGNREVFQLKHRMIEFLVTEMGFNVFALESPMAETFDLNEYVLTGTGDAAKALAGIYYWTWDTEEVLEVIEWIREYNADPTNARKVTFYGFDVQDPERAARVTLDYLQRVDPMLARAVGSDLGVFAIPFSLPEYGGRRQIIPREGHTSAVRAVGEVVSRLDARKDEYIAATSAAEWTLARQHARLLARYIEASSNDAHDWGSVRDRAMAENVQWTLGQEGDDAKIVLWAHNSHVANASHWGYEFMGSHLRRMFGPEMVIFGFLFNRGSFRAIDAGVPSEGMRNFTVGPAPEGTVEEMFASAGLELAVVDLRRITPGGPVAEWFRETRPTRHSGAGYDENDPERYLLEYAAPEAFDALVFVDHTTPVRHVNEADYDILWVREQRLPAPVNLDFEAGRPGEAPEGWFAWSKHRRLGFGMATSAERPHGGSYSAVVHRAPGQHYGEVAGSLSQRIDATPFRGKRIRLRAAARADVADSGSFAFLRLAIDGRALESVHDPAAPLFDSLDESRVTSSEWRMYEIVADVPEDAVVISYGLFLVGVGAAWLDTVTVEAIDG